MVVLWMVAAVFRLMMLLAFIVRFLMMVLGKRRLLKMGLLTSFIACFSLSPMMTRLGLSMHVGTTLVCSKQRFPEGEGSPFCTTLSL